MTLDKVLHQSQDRGSTWTFYSTGMPLTLKFTLKTKNFNVETLLLFFESFNTSFFGCVMQFDKLEILAPWRMLYVYRAAYSKDYMKTDCLQLFYSSLMVFMMMSLTSAPLKHKKHTQCSRSHTYKVLKACATVIKATAYCLQNLGSELGVRCYLILFTEHLFIGFTYTAGN